MKAIFKISILLAVLTIVLQGCSKKDDPNGNNDLPAPELTCYVSDASLNVQKSGSTYNITFTGTTSNISGSKQYNFRLTYGGPIKALKI